MASVFSPGVVFQRNRPIRIWGWGPENARVEVELEGVRVSVRVCGGAWEAVVPARSAGGPFVLEIRGGDWTHRVEEVLVGEVLLCSGQSNCEVTVSTLATRDEIVPMARNPRLRIFTQESQPVAAPALEVRNGRWNAVTPESAPELPALPLLLGLRLQEALGVPVGILNAAVGGTGIASWLPGAVFQKYEDLKVFWDAYPWHPADEAAAYARWEADRAAHDAENARRSAAGEAPLLWTKYLFLGPRGPRCVAQPAGLFNGEIHPLARFPIGAALWYQGETDAEEPSRYERHLKELIATWRAVWGAAELPFFVVQLVRYGADATMANWPAIREAQAHATEQTPHASLVPALDLGDPADIHPADKALLGERIARLIRPALAGEAVAQAPRIARLERLEDGSFKAVFSRPVRVAGDEVSGFEAAGAEGVFRKVPARRLSLCSLRVETRADDVELRYLWQGVPEVNLFSEDGLPPLPFRTDAAPAPFREEWHYLSAWPAGVERQP
ncbi:MAG: sialate O-acetylesterase [Chthoniobacteraceae bacterium]